MVSIKKLIILLVIFSIIKDTLYAQNNDRYPIVLNMVHHNPGEPIFYTKYAQPNYLKELNYNGQVPKFFVECGITYDNLYDEIVPQKTEERLWIEREATAIQMQIDFAREANMPLYPFTDVLVLPKSVMEKFKNQMTTDGHLSILKPKTQEILRAQINGIFDRFPELDGLTIRHGETYLFDTPFHIGETPARTPKEHIELIKILKEEICVKRNKTLFYRTWDFGFFHTQPDFYKEVTDAIESHSLLYFSIKHTNADFLRNVPFNTTIGLGKHQQIVEISINQAGLYGKNSHPYYIGKGIIEGWPEMTQKKGIKDLYDDSKIKGFWVWTWGDGWAGPYFSNEMWIHLNEYIIRQFAKNPLRKEEDIFKEYAVQKLHLSDVDAKKFRELCLLSVNAVYLGQASNLFDADAWWARDQYLTAINLKEVITKALKKEVITEKKKNLDVWRQMEQLSREINMKNEKDNTFLKVSTTYGRIKYEIIDLIWKLQLIAAEVDLKKNIDKKELKNLLEQYEYKWNEWQEFKKNNPSCPTLYLDNKAVYVKNPFQESVKILKALL
ncbi:hypothetical protein CJ739_2977 [Mariniflexile rhizosphaerae]|uniref:hypothetical protein n=1 Tax=unclassified Mariniflexile TaxID=2643887 RepID=UPI000E332800|nr:hypothetical protein [Mariniflexile sp. TRM1-10]AXP82040.1 hypothetical protein CJ739_2977 [Mariniflexile sp. TRM1-10]